MKKILIAAAVVFAMAACSGSKTEAENKEESTDNKEVVEKEEGVVVLDNDEAYRPGIKPEMPTILDFNATWCPPCRAFAPVFHAAAETYPAVKFVSVDVDNLPLTAEAYGVRNIPTVILISPDGKETRFVGTEDLLPAEKFDLLVKDLIK